METAAFNIGLDFGTSLTKVCVQHMSQKPRIHEFIQFVRPDGRQSFFLPSRVAVRSDDTLAYGYECEAVNGKVYNYFKISSAEDVDFRVESGLDRGRNLYNVGDYDSYTPELLSVLYLTYVLLYVKEFLRRTNATPQKKRTGIASLLVRQKAIPIRFTVQLGLPTEYSSEVNLLRRRKFETMLLIAHKLQSAVDSVADYLQYTMEDLRGLVRAINEKVGNQATTVRKFDQHLDEAGLAVYPESAAGLTFLLKTGRINPGYYAAIDIGGGSTDVSYFRVNSNHTTSYLASESLLLASNNVYRAYDENEDGSSEHIKQIESRVKGLIEREQGNAIQDDQYRQAIEQVTELIHRAMFRIFVGRVYWLFDRGPAFSNLALGSYSDQPCFVYGGGANLPIPPHLARINVHYHGNPMAFKDSSFTWIQRQSIGQHLLTQNPYLIPQSDELNDSSAMLVVAYGLSFPHFEGEALWDDNHYTRKKMDLVQQPHPINEGMYVYDVIEREWVGS